MIFFEKLSRSTCRRARPGICCRRKQPREKRIGGNRRGEGGVRGLVVAVAIVVGGWFVAGCAQPASPSSPGPVSLGSSLGPTAVTNHDLPLDEISNVINPCTGVLTTVTVHYLKVWRARRLTDRAASTILAPAVAEVSTADGFSGKVTFHFTFVDSPGGSGIDLTPEVNSFVLHNDAGQTLVGHFLDMDVRKDGVTVVQFEVGFSECRGKPV